MMSQGKTRMKDPLDPCKSPRMVCPETSLTVHIVCKVHEVLRRPQNFAKSSPYFCPQYIQTKVRWRFCKILWPFRNIRTLSPAVRYRVRRSLTCFCSLFQIHSKIFKKKLFFADTAILKKNTYP